MRGVTERFWSKVDRSGGPDVCWPWTGYVDPDRGYGQFWEGTRLVKVHRFAAGATDHDGDVDHICHNRDETCAGGPTCRHRRCCNPDHLTPTDHAANVRAGRAGAREAARTHCPRGHAYDLANTYVNPRGHRKCRACRRIHQHEYHARKAANT